ncbi:MAG: hypothetical protein HFJ28_04560 [Clostridia bacterium]|nr:hypothetical protein [Clostridia bacterium]
MKKQEKIKGITLIALVVTIVVLLILAGITIQVILQGGIIETAGNASEQYKIAAAREKISITLSSAQMDKATNIKYNQEDYLDEFIVNNMSNTEVIEDIVITDGYAFELDRSVPKIGEYLGKKEDLVFPEITISQVILAVDSKSATFTITTKEKENGINKIEILQEGHVIESYEFANEKQEIVKEYTAKQNGKYVIKVYAKYAASKIVEVAGIMPSISFEPNGNEEYKKEHSTKIKVIETADKVETIKYQWTNSTKEPEKETFQDTCQNGDIITKNGLTGTYYLWTFITTKTGKNAIWRSEGFNFDNEGPEIISFTAQKYSGDGITLTVNAQDVSKVVKCEYYVEDVLKDTIVVENPTNVVIQNATISGLAMGTYTCKVKVYDEQGNSSETSISAATKLHTWKIYTVNPGETYYKQVTKNSTFSKSGYSNQAARIETSSSINFDRQSGIYTCSGELIKSIFETQQGMKENPTRYLLSRWNKMGSICFL